MLSAQPQERKNISNKVNLNEKRGLCGGGKIR